MASQFAALKKPKKKLESKAAIKEDNLDEETMKPSLIKKVEKPDFQKLIAL